MKVEKEKDGIVKWNIKYKIRTFLHKRKWILFTTFVIILTFCLGLFGYLEHYNPFDSFYYTIRLFTFNIDFPQGSTLPWQVETARWLAMFVVVSNIVRTILLAIQQQLLLLLRFFQGGHYIICGLNEAANALARDLKASGKKVIIIEKDIDNELIEAQRKKGNLVIIGDPLNIAVLKEALLIRCSHFIVLTSDDGFNVELFFKACDVIRKERLFYKNEPIKCIVHIVEKQYEKVLDEFLSVKLQTNFANELDKKIKGSKEEDLQDNINLIDLKIINSYENSAKLLFNKKPLYNNVDIVSDDADPIHLVILGFGYTGKQILLQAAKIGHFPNGKKINVTIFDKEAKKKESMFRMRYPEIDHSCEKIDFQEFDVNTVEFLQYILSIKQSITYIAICFDDDQLDFTSASFLVENFKNKPIAVRMSKEIYFAKWLEENANGFNEIIYFGATEDIFCEELVIREKLENLAKSIHNIYTNKNREEGSWEKLNRFKKTSNIAQVDHIDTKLYSMGLCKKPKASLTEHEKPIKEEEYLKHIQSFKMKLAVAEHERWNGFHYVNGWKRQSPYLSKHQDADNKTHACLVSWNELDHVSEVRSRIEGKKMDFKSYDIEYIEKLYEILSSVDYTILLNNHSASMDERSS